MSARRLVVIGGGVSGLAAAWAAVRASPGSGVEVVVLERDDEVGGKARSVVNDGWLFEGGPGGFLAGNDEMDRLVNACGLSDELVSASPAAANRYVYRGGRVRRIVANPIGLLTHGVLSARGVARMLAELFVAARRGGPDESVWSFAARRFGTEVADRLIRPMALGIFAGDATRLSVGAAFPRMAALERERGSVLRAMLARRGSAPARRLMSFRSGMQSLPRALAARGGFAVRVRAEVRALERVGAAWRVALTGGTEPIVADAVILAGEPWAMARLVRVHSAAMANELDAIACPPVAVVALGFAPADAARVPHGFGVLIGRGEGFRMLGNIRDTHLFPERSPAGHLTIRAIFGGAVDADIGSLSDAEILTIARREVAQLYGIAGAPVIEHITRIPRAIPQYELGHLERVARIEQMAKAFPGLALTGFGLRGVAFADAATDGARVGAHAAADLASRL